MRAEKGVNLWAGCLYLNILSINLNSLKLWAGCLNINIIDSKLNHEVRRYMKTYIELLKLEVFTIYDVDAIYGNRNSAESAVRTLLKNGFVTTIKRNLYICNDVINKLPIADKFKIGSNITKDAYISHYSALEFHGFVWKNQEENEGDCQQDIQQGSQEESRQDSQQDSQQGSQLYSQEKSEGYSTVYVSSRVIFKPFVYKGLTYQPVASKFDEGVVTYNNQRGTEFECNNQRGTEVTCNNHLGTRVTNLERTVIDCIKDMDKAGGIEEFLINLCNVSSLDSEKLMQYLIMYDIQFLYQKAGFILEQLRYKIKLPQNFYNFCQNNIIKSMIEHYCLIVFFI